MKILIIEDEIKLANDIAEYLKRSGNICEIADTFFKGDEKAFLYDYDCILLDITLPGGSGLDILKNLKENKPDAAIIIISAKNSFDDKIYGLDKGADDYISKPFNLAELNSRINALVRRRNYNGRQKITYENITIFPSDMIACINDSEISLNRKEFDLLLFLMTNSDRVLTKRSIAEHIWGDDADMADSFDFIYSQVKNLRKKITENGGVQCIQSVYGIGYKFGSQ